MPPTVADVFEESVMPLAPAERLRLAALIRNDLSSPNVQALDVSDAWTREDELDLSLHTLRYAEERCPEHHEAVYGNSR